VMYQPTDWALVLALVLHRLGRVAELSPHIRAAVVRTPWTDAVEAVIADDLGAAADIVHAIGDLANEARLRLAAADDLRVAGKLDAAQRQLAPALSFFRSVGATACVRRAEALLPATA